MRAPLARPHPVRRACVIACFAAAVGLAGIGLASLWVHVGHRGRIADGHWAMAEMVRGNLRLGHARLTNLHIGPRINNIPLGRLGFLGIVTGTNRGGWRYIVITVPLWMLVALLLVYPTTVFIRGPALRRRRLRRHQCPACGYDRSGNTSGRCPECGQVLEAGKTPAHGNASGPEAATTPRNTKR